MQEMLLLFIKKMWKWETALVINIFPVPDVYYKHSKNSIFNSIDNPVIPYPDSVARPAS